jgi:NAD(P)H-hydrate epimerase
MLLSCQQCRQFDRIAIDEFGMRGIVLMENAGAACVREIFRRSKDGPTVLLCGGGNNGGDGFVMARHLQNANVPVHVILLADPAKISGDAKTNFDVLRKMDTSMTLAESNWTANDFLTNFESVSDHPLLVDAMLGTGAKGSLRDPYAVAVEASNQMSASRFAIDIPTGLDGDSGNCELAFKADVTCTFIARKTGFENPNANQWLGDVEVIDIGAPREIFDRFQIQP